LSVAAKLKTNAVVQIILASFTMLVYDVIIEQLAPVLDMWAWADDKVPVKNYLAWFVLAIFFNSILKIFNVQTANRLAPVILGCQLVFFIILRIVFKL
jgi:putative membrane protein